MGSIFNRSRGVALAVALTAIAPMAQAQAQDTTIGVLFLDSQGFFGEIQKGIVGGAGDAGITLISNNSESDPTKESTFLDTIIGAGAQAVIMSPVSAEGSVAAVERVKEAGIPIVCYNTCLSDADTERLVGGLVTTNQVDFGKDLGARAADYIAASGKAAVIGILNCDRYEACQQRKAGFIAALDEAGADYEVVADQEGFIADKAIQTASELLTANPQINLIWTANEGGTTGAVLGVQSSGLEGKTVVFGSDISLQIAQMLQDGTVLQAVIAQQPREMGREAIRLAQTLIDGGMVKEKLVYIPTLIVAADAPDSIQSWIDAQ